MKAAYYKIKAVLTGKNSVFTPKDVIAEQLNEKRPLPIGRAEFEAWSDRIISGAQLDGVTSESLKFSLCTLLRQLDPTECFKDDGFFIRSLRRSAIEQTAQAIMTEIKEAKLKHIADEVQANANAAQP